MGAILAVKEIIIYSLYNKIANFREMLNKAVVENLTYQMIRTQNPSRYAIKKKGEIFTRLCMVSTM